MFLCIAAQKNPLYFEFLPKDYSFTLKVFLKFPVESIKFSNQYI